MHTFRAHGIVCISQIPDIPVYRVHCGIDARLVENMGTPGLRKFTKITTCWRIFVQLVCTHISLPTCTDSARISVNILTQLQVWLKMCVWSAMCLISVSNILISMYVYCIP